MKSKYYVGNLAWETTDDQIVEVFVDSGFDVVDVKTITDRETGRSRGFCFVTLDIEDGGKDPLDLMGDKKLLGRKLRISEAREKKDRGFKDTRTYD